MIRISQIRLRCGEGKSRNGEDPRPFLAAAKARRLLRLKDDAKAEFRILRHGVDARKKPELYDVYTLGVRTGLSEEEEMRLVSRLHNKDIQFFREEEWVFPGHLPDAQVLSERPVIAGFGPAGIFAALALAENGYRPIILERGRAMEERIRDVDRFWESGELDEISNIQFGEGGAGTFSDGKLNTGVKDRAGRTKKVLQSFVESGAPEDILYEFHPHIGTDLLRKVIVNLRSRILSLGGEIRFETKLTGLITENGSVVGVRTKGPEGIGEIPAKVVILACGHSARDTIRSLYAQKIPMQRKDFAIGVRVSHPQAMIDAGQYGVSDPEEMKRLRLSPASYKLTYKASSGRGVYSFCMCPGGYIINASSEKGRLAVNGMSDHARDSKRANSAIVVTIGEKETGGDVLSGLLLQEKMEEECHRLAEGKIPVECFSDFEDKSLRMTETKEDLCIRGRFSFAPLHALFSEDLHRDLAEALRYFDRIIPGFDSEKAFAAGLESRTSSPVRILRGEDLSSEIRGLYPCGEGAGYAGGITSAAIDGLKVAEAVGKKYIPDIG